MSDLSRHNSALRGQGDDEATLHSTGSLREGRGKYDFVNGRRASGSVRRSRNSGAAENGEAGGNGQPAVASSDGSARGAAGTSPHDSSSLRELPDHV